MTQITLDEWYERFLAQLIYSEDWDIDDPEDLRRTIRELRASLSQWAAEANRGRQQRRKKAQDRERAARKVEATAMDGMVQDGLF